MITEETFRGMLEKLLVKSKANKVIWRAPAGIEGIALVELPSGTQIRVGSFAPDGAPDWARAELLLNKQTVVTIAGESDDDKPDYHLIKELYSDAMRCIHGFDKLLDELIESLDSEGQIGTKTSPPPDDDIPF